VGPLNTGAPGFSPVSLPTGESSWVYSAVRTTRCTVISASLLLQRLHFRSTQATRNS